MAAALYGVGARLDHKPELLFRLRAVNEAELVAHVDTALPMSKTEMVSDKVLPADDLSALFGLDMAEAPAIEPLPDDPLPTRPRRTASRLAGVASAATATGPKKQAPRRREAGAGDAPAAQTIVRAAENRDQQKQRLDLHGNLEFESAKPGC